MSTGPRIVFMRFVSRQSPKLEPWREHTRRVVGVTSPIVEQLSDEDDDDAAAHGVIAWHLVSANNRMLARSVSVYARFVDATSRAAELVALEPQLTIRLVGDELRGLYGWYASLGDLPAFTCSRWYLTERDRRTSIELARVALASATLSGDTRLVDPALTGRALALESR
jgi:hypothetical protein